MRSSQLMALAVAMALPVLFETPAVAQDPAPPVVLGTLGIGDEIFYQDPAGAAGSGIYSLPLAPFVLAEVLCQLGQPCFEFELELTETAPDATLRIGYDTPMRDDNFQLTVTDPNGVSTTRTNGNQYSVEAFFPNPAEGTWKLKLVPYSADEAPFRIRARLEDDATRHVPEADLQGQLLPNLRVFRVWEFGWAAPLNPANGLFPPDDVNPPLSIAGQEPVSCSLDEQLGFDGEPATRCLRYSFGLANVGEGNFDIRWEAQRTDVDLEHLDVEVHEMWQCVQMASGGPVARLAGSGHFHPLHGHWHYQDIVHHELFRVDDSTNPPTLVSTGNGKKVGYSPADQGMPEWDRFVQAASGTSGSEGNCKPETNNRLGMSQGWGDAYRYQRPGNFVSFGMNGDGDYVVTTTADPENVVLETDDTDNTHYAWLRITGDEIEILERGVGQSPWDLNRVVYEDWWTLP